MSQVSGADLPPELLSHIFTFLHRGADVMACEQVSRYWKGVVLSLAHQVLAHRIRNKQMCPIQLERLGFCGDTFGLPTSASSLSSCSCSKLAFGHYPFIPDSPSGTNSTVQLTPGAANTSVQLTPGDGITTVQLTLGASNNTVQLTPVDGTTPTVQLTPVDGTTPTVQLTPVDGTTPTVQLTPVDGTTHTGQLTSVDGTTPTVQLTPVDDTTPTVQLTPVDDTTHTGQLTPVDDTTHTVQLTPVDGTTHTDQLTPGADTTPTVQLTHGRADEKICPVVAVTRYKIFYGVTRESPDNSDGIEAEVLVIDRKGQDRRPRRLKSWTVPVAVHLYCLQDTVILLERTVEDGTVAEPCHSSFSLWDAFTEEEVESNVDYLPHLPRYSRHQHYNTEITDVASSSGHLAVQLLPVRSAPYCQSVSLFWRVATASAVGGTNNNGAANTTRGRYLEFLRSFEQPLDGPFSLTGIVHLNDGYFVREWWEDCASPEFIVKLQVFSTSQLVDSTVAEFHVVSVPDYAGLSYPEFRLEPGPSSRMAVYSPVGETMRILDIDRSTVTHCLSTAASSIHMGSWVGGHLYSIKLYPTDGNTVSSLAFSILEIGNVFNGISWPGADNTGICELSGHAFNNSMLFAGGKEFYSDGILRVDLGGCVFARQDILVVFTFPYTE